LSFFGSSALATPTQASILTSHPKPAEIIEKRLPLPHTTRPGAADQNGHPAKVKTKGRQQSRGKNGGLSI